jgi:hypothetical protein
MKKQKDEFAIIEKFRSRKTKAKKNKELFDSCGLGFVKPI